MPPPIKIQIVSRELPVKNLVGHYTYLLDFMQYLRQLGCALELVVLNPWLEESDVPAEVRNIASVVLRKFVPSSAGTSFSGKVKALLRRHLPNILKQLLRTLFLWSDSMPLETPQTWDEFPTQAEIKFVNTRFAEFQPHVVVISYVFLSHVLDNLSDNGEVLKTILTYDLRHQRMKSYRNAGYHSMDFNWTWDSEAELLRKADVILAIQNDDAKTFQQMVPHRDVFCIPMTGTSIPHTLQQISGQCLFVGSDVDHNVYSLQWFLHDVWPLIQHVLPESTLHICGMVATKITGYHPNVQLVGRVDDIGQKYAEAELCIIPLVVGSGLKIKLVEALTHGRACVSTSIGVQGIRDIVDRAVLVGDSAEDFAEAVLTVLRNPAKRKKMEKQAQTYVMENLSPEKVYQPFVDRIYRHIHQYSHLS